MHFCSSFCILIIQIWNKFKHTCLLIRWSYIDNSHLCVTVWSNSTVVDGNDLVISHWSVAIQSLCSVQCSSVQCSCRLHIQSDYNPMLWKSAVQKLSKLDDYYINTRIILADCVRFQFLCNGGEQDGIACVCTADEELPTSDEWLTDMSNEKLRILTDWKGVMSDLFHIQGMEQFLILCAPCWIWFFIDYLLNNEILPLISLIRAFHCIFHYYYFCNLHLSKCLFQTQGCFTWKTSSLLDAEKINELVSSVGWAFTSGWFKCLQEKSSKFGFESSQWKSNHEQIFVSCIKICYSNRVFFINWFSKLVRIVFYVTNSSNAENGFHLIKFYPKTQPWGLNPPKTLLGEPEPTTSQTLLSQIILLPA